MSSNELKELYLIWDDEKNEVDEIIAVLTTGDRKRFDNIDMNELAKTTMKSTIVGRQFYEKIDKATIRCELVSDLELESNESNGLSDYISQGHDVYSFSEDNEGVFCYYKSQNIDFNALDGDDRYDEDKSGEILARLAKRLYKLEKQKWEEYIEQINELLENEDSS